MIQPINDWVLLKSCPSDEISEGGIIVPDSCKKDSNKMEILAAGEGSEKTPMQFRKGQIAFRVKDWGTRIEYNGQILYMMKQQEILAYADLC